MWHDYVEPEKNKREKALLNGKDMVYNINIEYCVVKPSESIIKQAVKLVQDIKYN